MQPSIFDAQGGCVAWSAIAAITLLRAVLVPALAEGPLGAPSPAEPPIDWQPLSPATAALADGDDVRARFLVRLAGGVGGLSRL